MEPPTESPRTPARRSRTLVRPLLIGLIGVAASVLFAWFAAPIIGHCEGAGCSTLPTLSAFVLLLMPGLLITGFLAARSIPDAWLALGAVALAVMIDWLAAQVLTAGLADDSISKGLIIVAGLVVLPMIVGFGDGRLVGPRP
jgi:uncharacterized membrane protein YfcA